MTDYVATAEIDVAAPVDQVWHALTDPDSIEQYFFGAKVHTDWQPGSPIVWRGQHQGKPFEDKGEILTVEDNRVLRMTHFSPLSGLEDAPENYHTLAFTLAESEMGTWVELSQDNNSTQDEADGSAANWTAMLQGLKRVVEQ
jgi:uncharacterized protein YndB with AHSA1/START domain